MVFSNIFVLFNSFPGEILQLKCFLDTDFFVEVTFEFLDGESL